jgi:hypothetical protein
MRGQLRLPAVLSVAVMTATCGGGGGPDVDARPVDGAMTADATQPDAVECINYCFPDGTGTGNECPFPTCATGPDNTMCPDHCTIGI